MMLSQPPKQERNHLFIPYIGEEGYFTKYLPEPPVIEKEQIWYENLAPHERMFYHQTLNSARRFARFRPRTSIPRDSLDFILQAGYDHAGEVFPNKSNPYIQHETIGRKTFRRLKNSRDLSPVKFDILGHPLQIGGTTDKISPHSVKLMNSGHHTQLTNPGYSRQPADGNFFNY